MGNDEPVKMNIKFIKITFLGNENVGKTALLSKYLDNKVIKDYKPSLNIFESKNKDLIIEGVKVVLKFWDFPGNKNWLQSTEYNMNGSEYYIFLYDVTDKSSFSSLKEWLDLTKPQFNINCSRILCGNKIDLNYKRVIPKIDGELFSAENNMKYFETSIITGEGIDELFNMIIENITQKIKKEYNINNNLNSNINLNQNKMGQETNKTRKENTITIGSGILIDNSNLIQKPSNDLEQIINKEKFENQNLLKRINELESELTKEKNINLKLNEKINILIFNRRIK